MGLLRRCAPRNDSTTTFGRLTTKTNLASKPTSLRVPRRGTKQPLLPPSLRAQRSNPYLPFRINLTSTVIARSAATKQPIATNHHQKKESPQATLLINILKQPTHHPNGLSPNGLWKGVLVPPPPFPVVHQGVDHRLAPHQK